MRLRSRPPQQRKRPEGRPSCLRPQGASRYNTLSVATYSAPSGPSATTRTAPDLVVQHPLHRHDLRRVVRIESQPDQLASHLSRDEQVALEDRHHTAVIEAADAAPVPAGSTYEVRNAARLWVASFDTALRRPASAPTRSTTHNVPLAGCQSSAQRLRMLQGINRVRSGLVVGRGRVRIEPQHLAVVGGKATGDADVGGTVERDVQLAVGATRSAPLAPVTDAFVRRAARRARRTRRPRIGNRASVNSSPLRGAHRPRRARTSARFRRTSDPAQSREARLQGV